MCKYKTTPLCFEREWCTVKLARKIQKINILTCFIFSNFTFFLFVCFFHETSWEREDSAETSKYLIISVSLSPAGDTGVKTRETQQKGWQVTLRGAPRLLLRQSFWELAKTQRGMWDSGVKRTFLGRLQSISKRKCLLGLGQWTHLVDTHIHGWKPENDLHDHACNQQQRGPL